MVVYIKQMKSYHNEFQHLRLIYSFIGETMRIYSNTGSGNSYVHRTAAKRLAYSHTCIETNSYTPTYTYVCVTKRGLRVDLHN